MDLLERVDVEKFLHVIEAHIRIAAAETERERGTAVLQVGDEIGRHHRGLEAVSDLTPVREVFRPVAFP